MEQITGEQVKQLVQAIQELSQVIKSVNKEWYHEINLVQDVLMPICTTTIGVFGALWVNNRTNMYTKKNETRINILKEIVSIIDEITLDLLNIYTIISKREEINSKNSKIDIKTIEIIKLVDKYPLNNKIKKEIDMYIKRWMEMLANLAQFNCLEVEEKEARENEFRQLTLQYVEEVKEHKRNVKSIMEDMYK